MVQTTSLGIALIALFGTEAKTPQNGVFSNLKNVPEDAFKDVPSLVKKERQSRSRFAKTIAANARPRKSRNLNDGGGDEGQYVNYWNQDMTAEDFGFNIQDYSMKYTGCHKITGFDEDIAGEENFDTVLGQQNFVTFRMCESSTCEGKNGYSYGCTSNYGEYMIELSQYVEALTYYRSEKKQAFCQYCEICAAMKGYKAWNNKEQGSIQSLVSQAQAQFEQYVTNYAYDYQNQYGTSASGNQNGGGYSNAFLKKAKIAYWKEAKNSMSNNNQGNGYDNMYGTYGNNYGNQNGNGQQAMDLDDVFGGYSKFWNYQVDTDISGNTYQQDADWQNINNNFYTYCGRPLLNGYFDENGDFLDVWGFFDQDGEYKSLEDGEPVIWDESCHGKTPNGWQYVMGNDPNEFQECDYQYSQSCSSNYLECQSTLYYDDMEAIYQGLANNAYNNNQNGNGNNNNNNNGNQKATKFMQAFEKQESERIYTEALTCQQVDYYQENDDIQDNTYTNQMNYEKLYEKKQAYQEAEEECANSDDYDGCMGDIQDAIDADVAYTQWIIKSAWDEYAKIKAMNAQYFIGATCTDSYNIGLEVYSDENCMVPHPSATVSDLMGDIQLGYDLITKDCIPCHDNQFQVDTNFADGYGQQDDDDDPGILAFCSMLYQVAGKCNENLTPQTVYEGDGFYQDGVYYASTYSMMYGSEQQQANEKRICAMVESLNSGTYNEDGSINLSHMGWASGQKLRNELASASAGMSPFMKNMIFMLAAGAAAMGLWAMVLHGALARKTDQLHYKDPVGFARQESGIVMGRSRSGPVNPGSSPLI